MLIRKYVGTSHHPQNNFQKKGVYFGIDVIGGTLGAPAVTPGAHQR